MKASSREAQLVQHYLRAYGLVAIYVGVAPASGKTLLGYCHNIDARLRALETERGQTKIYGQWWCADNTKARQLIVALPRGTGAAVAQRQLPYLATVAGITLTADAEIQQHVRANLEAMRLRCARQLRALNADFKANRIARAAAGLKTIPYATFRHRNEIRMIYAEAAEHRR